MSKKQSFNEHEYVITVADQDSNLTAIVAVHSTVLGPAHGGTRMWMYKDKGEALEDVLRLSKAMSYKSALAGLPYGGAKGVIIQSKSTINRDKLLKAYAEKINKLGGLFCTGTDVGLTDEDTTLMSKYTKYILGLPKKQKTNLTTSLAASKGVYLAIKAAAKQKYGSDNLSGKVIGVKGVGKLGGGLVDLLMAEGATVVIADIDQAKIDALTKKYPEIAIGDPQTLHMQKLHVFAPCAMGNEFDKKSISNLACDIVAGGANNQLSNDKAGDIIDKKGIIYIPDYVANAGGLIYVCEDLEKDGFNEKRVEKRLNNIYETVTMLLQRSKTTGLPPHRVADIIAEERIMGIK